MLTRISPEKIREVASNMKPFGAYHSYIRAGAQAQLEADQKKVQEIFDEIEKHTLTEEAIVSIYHIEHIPLQETQWWQTLKERVK